MEGFAVQTIISDGMPQKIAAASFKALIDAQTNTHTHKERNHAHEIATEPYRTQKLSGPSGQLRLRTFLSTALITRADFGGLGRAHAPSALDRISSASAFRARTNQNREPRTAGTVPSLCLSVAVQS